MISRTETIGWLVVTAGLTAGAVTAGTTSLLTDFRAETEALHNDAAELGGHGVAP